MADLQRTVYPHSGHGHPLAEGRVQDRVSSPAKDRRSANCAMQPTVQISELCESPPLMNVNSFPVRTEAGVVLDLLESLARHLPTVDVSSQQRLAEMKYKLLSTKVDPNDKKQVYELSSQALESGTYMSA